MSQHEHKPVGFLDDLQDELVRALGRARRSRRRHVAAAVLGSLSVIGGTALATDGFGLDADSSGLRGEPDLRRVASGVTSVGNHWELLAARDGRGKGDLCLALRISDGKPGRGSSSTLVCGALEAGELGARVSGGRNAEVPAIVFGTAPAAVAGVTILSPGTERSAGTYASPTVAGRLFVVEGPSGDFTQATVVLRDDQGASLNGAGTPLTEIISGSSVGVEP